MSTINGWTAEEVADLVAGFPEYIRTDASGQVVPLIDRAELAALMRRYPSNFRDAAPVDRNAPDAALRARYPSMFPKAR